MLQSQGEQHLLLMLETRNEAITRLERQVQALTLRLEEQRRGAEQRLSRAEQKRRRRQQRDRDDGLEEANRRAQQYLGQIEQLRAAQSQRLVTTNDARRMNALLAQQLDLQHREHEREREHFNARLAGLEAENCDLFVQNRVFEGQLAQVLAELQQRDTIEAEIQAQVYALLTQLKKLDADNAQLRSRLAARAKPCRSMGPNADA